jgi:hypothetical protein
MERGPPKWAESSLLFRPQPLVELLFLLRRIALAAAVNAGNLRPGRRIAAPGSGLHAAILERLSDAERP